MTMDTQPSGGGTSHRQSGVGDGVARTLRTREAEFTSIDPAHYRSHPSGIECIEISRLCMSDMGQAIQYIWRAEDKNGLEDYRKAAWFLRDLVASGGAHYPPAKAREKLREACQVDNCPRRRFLLQCIQFGELARAIDYIDMMGR